MLSQPVVELVSNATGQWNFADLTSQPASGNAPPVTLSLLQVEDGAVAVTALVNGKGEMMIPAIVTGTFAKPRFAPDAARMADLKLKTMLPSVTGPGGIQGILSHPQGTGRSIPDALSGRQQASSDPPAEGDQPKTEPPANGAHGIIHLFRKKRVTGRNRPSDRIAE